MKHPSRRNFFTQGMPQRAPGEGAQEEAPSRSLHQPSPPTDEIELGDERKASRLPTP